MKRLTPLKAIRANCIDCMAGSVYEVKRCHLTDCPLHPYRLGRNPARKGIGNANNLNKPRNNQLAGDKKEIKGSLELTYTN